MKLEVKKVELNEIRDFRVLFLHECNFQFVCNKCHDYGWADTYVFMLDGVKIGYGSVWGTNRREDRDTIFEFYVIPPYRKLSNRIFPQFHAVTKTVFVECQSNDSFLSVMLYEHAQNIRAEAILFEDHFETAHVVPGANFRRRMPHDQMGDDDSDYVLELNGEIAASGGLMLNYNIPFADIYMQVKEPFRRQGLGSLLVQELKKEAYHMGRVPAARCDITNRVSKATLLKSGLKICGVRLKGDL